MLILSLKSTRPIFGNLSASSASDMSLSFTPTSLNPISHGARFILSSPSPPSHPRFTLFGLRHTFQCPPYLLRKASIVIASHFDKGGDFGAADFDWGDTSDDVDLDVEDEGSPWEGAVVYKRSTRVPHIEYCTTLERLGLGKISSELSRSKAAAMGLRLTKAVKEFLDGTPVLVSVDVTRTKRDVIRLDGIVRTVITLGCNRCGEPASESVFSNFMLLLTEEPVEVPEVINMGVIFGEDKADPGAEFDSDDRLHFPRTDKEIDISKQIRDLVHLEITINAVCDAKCKGLCLKCGINLNNHTCNCDNVEARDVVSRPLGNLRKQMQQN